jgi:hypothetical protein
VCDSCNDHTDGNGSLERALKAVADCPVTIALAEAILNHPDKPISKSGDVIIVKGNETKLGRFIARRIKPAMTDAMVETFVSKVASKLTNLDEFFTVLTGKAIESAYRDSIGGHSCMAGSSSSHTRIYAENTDKVSLVTYAKNGFTARALLWKTDGGSTILDRIYPASGLHVQEFWDYAISKGWGHRNDNSYPSGNVSFTTKKKHKVTLKVASNREYPYMDSFHWGDGVDSNDCVTFQTYADGANYTANSTRGEYDGDDECNNRVECDECSDRVSEDDYTYIDDRCVCENCISNNYTYSELDGEYVNDHSVVRFADTGNVCHESNVSDHGFCCEGCNDCFEDNCNYSETDSADYCENCYCDRFSRCEDCSYEVVTDDAIDCDGDTCCQDCADKRKPECEVCGCDCTVITESGGQTSYDCTESQCSGCNEAEAQAIVQPALFDTIDTNGVFTPITRWLNFAG